eukprot:gnl/MRDRNA2_/MRDRNA2_155158_c0_seq1.p1 gnl/MRDRNA2_/MRDRNA2_155158_c0~~gnl/MRDRNA2_/MRDRNA2_155158_c0_seq1.p1  ORF type:complete len:154 (+),score=18.53 gnl/MRDRNA2_/MRDRNA2_155158_c0_seq1:102-563(+)
MTSGARLTSLLRFFNVPLLPGLNDKKTLEKALHQAYLSRSKNVHPDHQPLEKKMQAEKEFITVTSNYEDASRLLQQGVLPLHCGTQNASTWRCTEWESPSSSTMEFDLWTRSKGCSVVFIGGYMLWAFTWGSMSDWSVRKSFFGVSYDDSVVR